MTTGEIDWTSTVSGTSAVALDSDRTAISGPVDTTIIGPDGSVVTTGQPAFPGYWGGSPLEFAGDTWFAPYPKAVAATNAFVTPDPGFAMSFVGDGQGASRTQAPLIVTILPVDPLGVTPNTYTITDFRTRVANVIGLNAFDKAWVVKPRATTAEVLSAFKNGHASAVSFIGHSVLSPTSHLSIGIEANGNAIVNRATPPAVQEYSPNYVAASQLLVDSIETHATVVFVGSCNTNTAFQALFGIQDLQSNPHEKRALIVPVPVDPPPQGGDTDLRLASETAWTEVFTVLSAGWSVQEAIDDVNFLLDRMFRGGDIGHLLQFKVIGNGNAHIIK